MAPKLAGVPFTLRGRIIPTKLISAAALAAALAALPLLSACSGGPAALSSGLTARMDQPGASLNRAEALNILNAYRSTAGAGTLVADAGLDATAQSLASAYAQSGTAPKMPAGAVSMRVSAGYATFAETFSGWRNSPADAQVIAGASARRAGLGVAYNASSTYGVYWVLVLDD